jgi:hypothetical protein
MGRKLNLMAWYVNNMCRKQWKDLNDNNLIKLIKFQTNIKNSYIILIN